MMLFSMMMTGSNNDHHRQQQNHKPNHGRQTNDMLNKTNHSSSVDNSNRKNKIIMGSREIFSITGTSLAKSISTVVKGGASAVSSVPNNSKSPAIKVNNNKSSNHQKTSSASTSTNNVPKTSNKQIKTTTKANNNRVRSNTKSLAATSKQNIELTKCSDDNEEQQKNDDNPSKGIEETQPSSSYQSAITEIDDNSPKSTTINKFSPVPEIYSTTVNISDDDKKNFFVNDKKCSSSNDSRGLSNLNCDRDELQQPKPKVTKCPKPPRTSKKKTTNTTCPTSQDHHCSNTNGWQQTTTESSTKQHESNCSNCNNISNCSNMSNSGPSVKLKKKKQQQIEPTTMSPSSTSPSHRPTSSKSSSPSSSKRKTDNNIAMTKCQNADLGMSSCCHHYHHHCSQVTSQQQEPLAQVLITLKDQNKNLIKEIEDLRIKLEDAEGDLKLVQCQMRTMSKHIGNSPQDKTKQERLQMDNKKLINELEFYKEKVILLERDVQTLLDEKEELLLAKDDLQIKNEQLNEHLLAVLRYLPPIESESSTLRQTTPMDRTNLEQRTLSNDIDALYLENRYLKEKIKNDDEEKNLLLERLATYKDLIEQQQQNKDKEMIINQNKNNSQLKTKNRISESSFSSPPTCDIMMMNDVHDDDPSVIMLDEQTSQTNTTTTTAANDGQHSSDHIVDVVRDIEQMIAFDSIHSMEVNKSNQIYLWDLLLALFQGLRNKNINLVRARKTNQVLGKRIDELELQLGALEQQHHHQRNNAITDVAMNNNNKTPINAANVTKQVQITSNTSPMRFCDSIVTKDTTSVPSSTSIGQTDDLMITGLHHSRMGRVPSLPVTSSSLHSSPHHHSHHHHHHHHYSSHHHLLLPDDVLVVSQLMVDDGVDGRTDSLPITERTTSTTTTTNNANHNQKDQTTTPEMLTTTDEDEDRDGYSSTASNTTTRRSTLSIEQQLRQLQNEALEDALTTPTTQSPTVIDMTYDNLSAIHLENSTTNLVAPAPTIITATSSIFPHHRDEQDHEHDHVEFAKCNYNLTHKT